MGIKIKKYTFLTLFILLTTMIGGCNMGQNEKNNK